MLGFNLRIYDENFLQILIPRSLSAHARFNCSVNKNILNATHAIPAIKCGNDRLAISELNSPEPWDLLRVRQKNPTAFYIIP